MLLSADGCSLSGCSLDYGVVLGSVSFSRGVHYWEVGLDRLEPNADLVLGVAQAHVDRHQMLGRDLHGWAMYLDTRRSWCLHNGEHRGRREGGAAEGALLGVRLDCDRGRLSFHWANGPQAGRPLLVDGSPFAFQ